MRSVTSVSGMQFFLPRKWWFCLIDPILTSFDINDKNKKQFKLARIIFISGGFDTFFSKWTFLTIQWLLVITYIFLCPVYVCNFKLLMWKSWFRSVNRLFSPFALLQLNFYPKRMNSVSEDATWFSMLIFMRILTIKCSG